MKLAAALREESGWQRFACGRLRSLQRVAESAPCPIRASRCGFTLIELLLTLVILMLLLGAVVMNFTGLQSSSQLDEGVEQFESLVRYARAHAANSGCRVRLTFEEVAGEGELAVPLGNVFVAWEPDPLNKPGEFHPLREVAPLLETMLHFVEVDEVRPVGGGLAEQRPATERQPYRDASAVEEQSYGFEPITFYPDGSSDTAEVVFSARELDEERQVAVQIIGTTGTVRRYAIEIVGVEGGGAGEK
jgi:prepilin-type N-terminal cleavage/methylation domain-containing protein